MEAGISLEVRDRGGSKQLASLEPSLLFGSREIAGSLETLAPGETAWIRVPGFWRTSDREINAMVKEPDGAVQVRAVIDLLRPPIRVGSANGLEVSVRLRSLQ